MKQPNSNQLPIRYFQKDKLVEEHIEGLPWLKIIYGNFWGNFVRIFLMRFSWASKLYAWYQCSRLSRLKIKPFIKKHAIDMADFIGTADEFKSFNDFFCRQLRPGARMIEQSVQSVVSPGDGKLLVFRDVVDSISFFVKNERFNLNSFLKNDALAQEFEHATMAVLRLAPYDYHRFHLPIDAYVSKARRISGCYESVNPLAYRAGIQPLTENLRFVISLSSELFGHVLMIPVGAAMVGSIVFTYQVDTFCKKGSEVGYFQFGGSTVVLLFKAKTIVPQHQFLRHSLQGFETAVTMGQKIAE